MPVYRSKNLPHTFDPQTASKLGVTAAIVEVAIGQRIAYDDGTCDDTSTIEGVIEYCYYLSEHDIREAFQALIQAGMLTVEAD